MKVSFRLGMIMGIGLIFGFGCGDTGTPQPAPVVTGLAQGPITQFGSIFVMGRNSIPTMPKSWAE